MSNLKVDVSKALSFVDAKLYESFLQKAPAELEKLYDKSGKGNDFLGWVNLPSDTPQTLLNDIIETAKEIRKKSQIVVVVGIGGSYLGARSVIDALSHQFQCMLSDRNAPVVVFAGNNISEDYMADLLDVLNQKDYSLVVISKSGTTTEPAVAFRLLKQHIEKKYGKQEAAKRIVAVTDKSRGALKKLANTEGYKTYDIPDDVGGRFSVLTPVGLLPIAIAGFDITSMMVGAVGMQHFVKETKDAKINPAMVYAAIRNALLQKGKPVEMLVNYQPNLQYIAEWWKQLYGESEGKDGKGIIPGSLNFTADLHSMGQYVQEGQRILFETVLSVERSNKFVSIPNDPEDLDGLNFLNGKRLQEVNRMAEMGTLLAHIDGDVPNVKITIPKVDEHSIGELIYFFEIACGISGYLLDVNPFDQPGVEAYKKNMFALLGKPGFEEENKKLRSRLGI